MEKLGDVVELGMCDCREVDALGQKLAQQTVGVFVAAALPRRMRIGKPDIEI